MATVNTRAWPRAGVGALLRDQMTYRRLRIGAGLVLFTFLSLHLTMHALGNASYDTMKAATALHDAVWRTLPGAVLLYGAFAIHFEKERRLVPNDDVLVDALLFQLLATH